MVVTLDNKWVGNVAIVTGASSGIGEAIAERLIEEGMIVVGFARRVDRMEALAKRATSENGKFYFIKVDMSIEKDILNAFEWIKQNLGSIHVLVNNAGVAKLNLFTESDTKSWTDVLQVNVIGTCIAAREAIKSMKENSINGHIININSLMGHKIPNIPHVNMYAPSKHALTAINEVLRNELASLGRKIKVTSISPGLTNTELIDNARKVIHEVDAAAENECMLDPKNIAEAIVFVLSTPPNTEITELMIRSSGVMI